MTLQPLPPILPIGTQIVTKVDTRPIGGGAICPRGIVGVIINAPSDADHSYRVRCANGFEIMLRRREWKS